MVQQCFARMVIEITDVQFLHVYSVSLLCYFSEYVLLKRGYFSYLKEATLYLQAEATSAICLCFSSFSGLLYSLWQSRLHPKKPQYAGLSPTFF